MRVLPGADSDRPASRGVVGDRLRPVLQIAAGVALFFLIDRAFTAFYLNWVDPHSGLGMTLSVTRLVSKPSYERPLILMFGDSRMGEGFSPNLANDEAKRLGAPFVFANSAVPATTPRVWYYLLRYYRALGLRPAAVVLMTESFRDEGNGGDSPDRLSDILFVHPWLGLADLPGFSLTFADPAARKEAAESILFRARPLQPDVEDFLLHPLDRRRDARDWRKHGSEWLSAYSGNEGTLAGLRLDLDCGTISSSSGNANPAPALDYAARLGETRGAPQENSWAHEYIALWYSAIARQCGQMGARLIVLRIPRGPFHSLVGPGPEPHGAFADLSESGQLTLIPQTEFASLERPEFFFDQLHMNRNGREAFSAMLAAKVIGILAKP
jgi:hypothetical protein